MSEMYPTLDSWIEFTCKKLPEGEHKRFLIYIWWESNGQLTWGDKDAVHGCIGHKATTDWDACYGMSIWDTKAEKELDWEKLITVSKDF